MRQSLVPVLLLAAVALSSSNVLPITDGLQQTTNGQQNDNTRSYRHNSRDILSNMFYSVPLGTQRSRLLRKLTQLGTNSDWTDIFNDILNEEDNYDGKGFRKEQWHNYPRQLDRLQDYLTEYHKGDTKRSNIDRPEDYEMGSKETFIDTSNENPLDINEINTYDETDVAASNHLFIFKVHLTCLSNQLKNTQAIQSEPDLFQTPYKNENVANDLKEELFTNEINSALKVKREGVTSQQNANTGERTPGKKKTKRLFSLWSRLQSLSHKGHELPHRRHLAFYGFPEGDGGGALTAETRAMVRPPGSPLRWG